jgi:hypothetical protein
MILRALKIILSQAPKKSSRVGVQFKSSSVGLGPSVLCCNCHPLLLLCVRDYSVPTFHTAVQWWWVPQGLVPPGK